MVYSRRKMNGPIPQAKEELYMTVKEELRALVDQLPEEKAKRMVTWLRSMVQEGKRTPPKGKLGLRGPLDREDLYSDLLSHRDAMDLFRKNRNYFEAHKQDWAGKYPGRFVAVWDESLLDMDEDKEALAARVYRKIGYVPVYIGQLTDELPIFRISSPVMAR